MKTTHRAALAFLAFFAAASGHVANAAEHHHHEHASEAPKKLSSGKKWDSDEHLRKAMSGVNEAMAKALPLIRKDSLQEADYAMLAATINQKVAYAVANCTLTPEADAALHGVIAEMSSGVEAMEGKGQGASRHDGAVRVLKALATYGKLFRHPGWMPAHL